MSFMQPEIVYSTWAIIDGVHGSECTDLETAGIQLPENVGQDDWFQQCLDTIKDFTEYRDVKHVTDIEIKKGYGARMQAPGYMDATDWCVFDTEKEAIEYLLDMYADDLDEELEDWVIDLLNDLYKHDPTSPLFDYYGYWPNKQ